MAHGNGIGAISLETEEDIRKWREERRKNYPIIDRAFETAPDQGESDWKERR